jgi:hypothetical protein
MGRELWHREGKADGAVHPYYSPELDWSRRTEDWKGGLRPRPAATRVMSLPVERSNLSIGPVSPGATGATEVMFLLITEALCGT